MFTPGIGFSKFTIQTAENIGSTYKTITINKTYVPSTQTNYVLKLDASILGSDFFTKLAIGGSPRFTNSTGTTKLPFEKIFLNTGTSKGYYNVLVPTVNGTGESSSTSIRVYYENSLSDYPVNYSYGRNAVWANDSYKCVQHLHTTPDQLQVNSVGNSSYDMTGLGSLTSSDVITAYYGGGNAHLYDNTGQGVKVSFCDISAYPFTIGVVYKNPTDPGNGGYIAGISDTTSSQSIYGFNKIYIKTPTLNITNGANGLTGGATTGGNINNTNWHFIVAVYSSATSRTIYLNNDTPVTTTSNYAFSGNYNSTFVSYADLSSDVIYSNSGGIAAQDFFLMGSAMTADRITTMYNNYTNGSFFTIT